MKIKIAFNGKFLKSQMLEFCKWEGQSFPFIKKEIKASGQADPISWLDSKQAGTLSPDSWSTFRQPTESSSLLPSSLTAEQLCQCYNVLLERCQGKFTIQTHPVLGHFHRSFLLSKNSSSEMLISAKKCFYMESPFNTAFETIPFHALNSTQLVC